MNAKIDLTKEDKPYYKATKKPTLLRLPQLPYLSVEGQGDPKGPLFVESVQAMYALAYTVKTICKKEGRDFVVPKMEALWWVSEPTPFAETPRAKWRWKILIRLPSFVSADTVAQARQEAADKKSIDRIDHISKERLAEGPCVQILHIGPYADEGRSIAEMQAFMEANGWKPHGPHHEIYLSDPRKTASEKLKTILRQPVKKG